MKKKLKINVKTQVPQQPAQQTKPAAPPQQSSAPAQQGDKKNPSVMILVPAMEMVNAEFAQHLAMILIRVYILHIQG